MSALLNDIRFALRMFGRNPGNTAVAVISLALAIGPNTTLFSVVDRLFLRPPPIPGLSATYQLTTRTAEGYSESSSYPDYLDYQAALGDAGALVAHYSQGVLLTVRGQTTSLPMVWVSENFFPALETRPAAGRVLGESDRRFEGDPPMMVSYRLWQRTFGGDPSLPGKSVLLNNRPFRIVGVLPAGFRLPGAQIIPVDVWLPFSAMKATGSDFQERRESHSLNVWARLRSPADRPRAEAILTATTARLARDFPRTNHGRAVVLRSEADTELGVRTISLIALSVVGLVLIIACANIAGIVLAQGEERRREFAVRLAMGARGGRLLRQLLTESVLLSLMAAGAGTVLAIWLVAALPSLLPPLPMSLDFDFRIDGRVLAYTLGLSFATAIACGLYPAWRAARPDLTVALKGDAPHRPGHFWFRSGLLLAQIAVAEFLLAGAGLLARSYLEQQRIAVGFDMGKSMAVATVIRMDGPIDLAGLCDRLRSVPGVRRASWAMRLPLSASGGGARQKVSVPGVTREPVSVGWTDVGPGYFGIMGTRILRGREFLEFEPGHPVVVNERMARQFWGGADAALGMFIRIGDKDLQVTGVAEDGKYSELLEEPRPWLFTPASRNRGEAVVMAEVSGDARAALPTVRQALNEAAPGMTVASLTTLAQHMRIAFFMPQTGSWLVGGIALLGVFLAAVGLYGMMAYSVNRRSHEIGVRMALGARPRDVLTLVTRQAAWLVAAGSATGLVAAMAGAKIFSSLLYRVSPADPTALLPGLAIVAVLALASAQVPARRAVRLDPMKVLRRE